MTVTQITRTHCVRLSHVPSIHLASEERLTVVERQAVSISNSPIPTAEGTGVLIASGEDNFLDEGIAILNMTLDRGLPAALEASFMREALDHERRERFKKFQGGSFLVSTVSASLNISDSSYDLFAGTPYSVALHQMIPDSVTELGNASKRFELELLGTLSVALNREILNTPVARLVRSEGDSRQVIHASFSLKASGFASAHLSKGDDLRLIHTWTDLQGRSSADVIRSIARASEKELDPSISFILMFTSLEQLLKDQTPNSVRSFRDKLSRFLSAVNLATDYDEVMRLYDIRNDLAHEGILATPQNVSDLRTVLGRIASAAP